MFPLSEMAIFLAAYAAILALCTIGLYAVLRRSMRLGIGLGLGGAVVITLLALIGGGLANGLVGPLLFGLVVVCALPLWALLWALVLHRFVPRFGVGAALSLIPALALAGWAIERQTLPNATCTHRHLPLEIGDAPLSLPPAFGADIRRVGGGDFLTYGRERRKEEWRELCDLSSGGERTLKAEVLWLAPMFFGGPVEEACVADVRPAFCSTYKPAYTRYIGAFQIMERSETALRYELSQAGKTPADGIAFEGDEAAGHMCKVTPETGLAESCRVWRSVGSGAVALILSGGNAGGEDAGATLRDLDEALGFYLRALTP